MRSTLTRDRFRARRGACSPERATVPAAQAVAAPTPAAVAPQPAPRPAFRRVAVFGSLDATADRVT